MRSYDAINVMADNKASELEYWHNGDSKNKAGWKRQKPPQAEIRIPGVVHEASTLYMGTPSDPKACVDDNYRPFGSKNVYVTGAALFPSAGTCFHPLHSCMLLKERIGSWNPTLTMCGYAQDLARKLCKREVPC